MQFNQQGVPPQSWQQSQVNPPAAPVYAVSTAAAGPLQHPSTVQPLQGTQAFRDQQREQKWRLFLATIPAPSISEPAIFPPPQVVQPNPAPAVSTMAAPPLMQLPPLAPTMPNVPMPSPFWASTPALQPAPPPALSLEQLQLMAGYYGFALQPPTATAPWPSFFMPSLRPTAVGVTVTAVPQMPQPAMTAAVPALTNIPPLFPVDASASHRDTLDDKFLMSGKDLKTFIGHAV